MNESIQPTGHHAEYGGLQNHSVGEHYPLCVVGYGHPTLYVVENLTTNETLCDPFGRPYQHLQSSRIYEVIDVAAKAKSNNVFVQWVKGRPKFNATVGRLMM